MQTCAVIIFERQRIEYYDSLGGVDDNTIECLLRWVEDEYADKYKKPLPESFQVKPASERCVTVCKLMCTRLGTHIIQQQVIQCRLATAGNLCSMHADQGLGAADLS
jgi:hypothetical protein